jgi:hypothetical protein
VSVTSLPKPAVVSLFVSLLQLFGDEKSRTQVKQQENLLGAVV